MDIDEKRVRTLSVRHMVDRFWPHRDDAGWLRSIEHSAGASMGQTLISEAATKQTHSDEQHDVHEWFVSVIMPSSEHDWFAEQRELERKAGREQVMSELRYRGLGWLAEELAATKPWNKAVSFKAA